MRIKRLLYGSLFIFFLFIGILNLYKFNEIDQSNLAGDAVRFIHAVGEGNYAASIVSTRTGVTLHWLIGGINAIADTFGVADLARVHRLGLLIVRFSLLVSVFLLLKRINNQRLAGIVTVYLMFNSMFMAGIQSTWLDKFVSIFGLLLILTWLNYQISKKADMMVFSGVLLGLVLLTKPAGIIIVSMLFLIFGFAKLFDKRYLRDLLIVGCIGAVTYVLLYPAMWTDPLRALFIRGANDQGGVFFSVGGDGDSGLLFYPSVLVTADITLAIGSLLLIWELIQHLRKKLTVDTYMRLGMMGVYYLCCVAVVSLLFYDTDTGRGAFFSIRYVTPAIPFLSIYLFERISRVQKVTVRWIVFLVIFAYSVMQLDIMHYFVRAILIYVT